MTARRILPVALIGYWFLKGLLWVVLVPPWQAPDEPTHFAYAYELSRLEPRDRTESERRILTSLERFHFWEHNDLPPPDPRPTGFYAAPLLSIRPSQAGRPTLYYRVAAGLLRLVPEKAVHVQLLVLRLLSLVLGTATMLLIFAALRTGLGRESPVPALALGLAVLNPQVSAILTSVNSDVPLCLLAALFFFLLIRQLDRPRPVELPGLAFCLLAAVLVKRSGLLLIPALLAALPALVAQWTGENRRLRCGRWAILLPWGLLGAWMGAGWLAPGLLRQLLLQGFEQWDLLGRLDPATLGGTDWLLFFRFLWESYVLNPGWLTHPAPDQIYRLTALVYGSAGLGLILGVLRPRSGPVHPARGILPTAWAILLATLGAVVLAYGFQRALSQGRYLFPALGPICLLTGLGWERFRAGRLRWVAPAMVAVLALLDGFALLGFVLPEFYLG